MWHAGSITEMYTILIGKSEWKRLLGRPTRRWDANIKLDFKGNGWADVDWNNVIQDTDERGLLHASK